MRFDIITIFPKIFDSWVSESIVKKAIDKGLIQIITHDIREHALQPHRSVDDTPYGGGAGMVMRPEPIVECVESIPLNGRCRRILLTPQGEPLKQPKVKKLAEFDQIMLICGRYEGVDERARKIIADEEISLGDYVTAGGEMPAVILMEAVLRLIPGVIGNNRSLEEESFEGDLLEYPQYTRPEVFRGEKVPDILLSGHHAEIANWRRQKAIERTKERRPDLVDKSSKKG